jgi:pSer/pThr/pTyr-binding forkhead associated (FHA) protein
MNGVNGGSMSKANLVRHGWIITVVSTGRQYRFMPGDAVIIGRTPLRPAALPHENAKRLDIDDAGKSMSKRHLELTIDHRGEGVIEDLGSTNGTYVVRSDGRLVRIPAHKKLKVDEQNVRLQLGEVGIRLSRFSLPVSGTLAPQSQEQSAVFDDGAADHIDFDPVHGRRMNVDQILDIRAGEPTTAVDVRSVRQSVRQSRRAGTTGLGRFDPSAPAGATGFEPGSIFDRITRGQLQRDEPVVTIEGMTSEEAKSTSDHNKQFAMARHHEFLPFLAVNPYLYEELYAWLEAIGDPDISAALSTNPGFKAYKKRSSNA